MDAVVLSDLQPRHVIEDAIELSNIGHVVDERCEEVLLLRVWFRMPYRPVVLEGKWTEFGDKLFVQR